jgi:hypothetical protein
MSHRRSWLVLAAFVIASSPPTAERLRVLDRSQREPLRRSATLAPFLARFDARAATVITCGSRVRACRAPPWAVRSGRPGSPKNSAGALAPATI